MHKAKVRGNGQGCAYKSGKSWEAQVVIGYRTPRGPSKQPIPIKRKKRGFQTKAAALAYCPILLAGGREPITKAPRLFEYWETYKKGEYANLSKSKQTAYTIAWNRLNSLHDLRVDTITVEMLRTAVSSNCQTYYPARDCRSLLSNLFSLAGADRFADKDLPSFIVLPPLEEKEQTPFSVNEQAALWKLYESGDIKRGLEVMEEFYPNMEAGRVMLTGMYTLAEYQLAQGNERRWYELMHEIVKRSPRFLDAAKKAAEYEANHPNEAITEEQQEEKKNDLDDLFK